MIKIKENKWLCGALPALLIHSCIGSVYCWSLLKGDIAQEMGLASTSPIEFAFSLAIFSLGMSAAFGGRFVEKNVKNASVLSMICFISGLLLSALAIKGGSILGLFLSYGALMGIGLGIGYLSPVKTLMLWFSKHPGLATGIAISGFGLSKVLFSPIIEYLFSINLLASEVLTAMAGISFLPMLLASLFIKKPEGWTEPKDEFKFKDALKVILDSRYIRIWLLFYLNITCGLALISFEKSIALSVGISGIALLSATTALFNTVGRFGYSTCSDLVSKKIIIYLIIFFTSTIFCLGSVSLSPILLIITLCIINAGYGGGFSTLPILLKEKFGMNNISTIHGFALSAWAWAGLSGNQLSSFIINNRGLGYDTLFLVVGIIYIVALGIAISLFKDDKRSPRSIR